MPQPPLAPDLQARIIDMARSGASQSSTAREMNLNRNTVIRYWPADVSASRGLPPPRPLPPSEPSRVQDTLPPAKDEPPALPAPHPEGFEPVALPAAGTWLVIGDIHIPYHDRTTLELAVAEARRRGVAGVLLNGDVLDSHEVSTHDKDPAAPRYVHEVETGRQFFAWLRGQLPAAAVVYKEGNHEERLTRYVIQRAPALFGLEGLDLPGLLHLKDHGVQWVGDKRVVNAGKLAVIHGHEYRGGGGVNPARWLYLRARYVSMCSHFHRTSEHHERNIRDRSEAAWSLGCACSLKPRYMPINSWNHGFAFVEFDAAGMFTVDNKRVVHGKIV